MIASEEGDVAWIFAFETEEVFEGFDRIASSIYKITYEDIVCIGDLASLSE